MFDKIHISTDSNKIANLAKKNIKTDFLELKNLVKTKQVFKKSLNL